MRTEFARPENALIMCLSFLTDNINKINCICFITDVGKGKVIIHTTFGNRTAICVFSIHLKGESEIAYVTASIPVLSRAYAIEGLLCVTHSCRAIIKNYNQLISKWNKDQ